MEIIPAQVKVIENITFTYKCPSCTKEGERETIICSRMAPTPIPKSFASPSLLAYIATAKFQDALPLYRQESIFLRLGIELNRTTLARWMIQLGKLVRPLINLMHEDLLDQTVIGCDETPVQVLDEPLRAPEQKSYMWVCASLANVNIILFHYHMQRNAKTAATVLASYQGILVCDGLKSYDAYTSTAKTTLAGCMAHLRRAFYKAEKATKKAAPSSPAKATEVLQIIKKLYKIEEEIKFLSSAQRLANRQEHSRFLMEAMKTWLDEQHHKVLPKSLLGKAIRYARD